MDCQMVMLAQSNFGRVLYCAEGCQQILLSFNNIHQHFMDEDFYILNHNLQKFDLERFFLYYPNERKIFLNTSVPSLHFTFYPEEFVALQELLANAVVRLLALKAATEKLN